MKAIGNGQQFVNIWMTEDYTEMDGRITYIG